MAWYTYCIAERQAFHEQCRHRRPTPLEGVTGLFGHQTFLFPTSEFAIVVSEHNAEDNLANLAVIHMNQQAQRDHARVVADCFKLTTVLPFRFGTMFPNDETLRRSVRSNQRRFAANLERLRGKAEMHLMVLMDGIGPQALEREQRIGPQCQQYLASLRQSAILEKEQQSQARSLSVQMHRMFLPLAEEVTCRRMESGKVQLDIAHLIEHRMVERYQNKYTSAATMLKQCRMHLSGPWPPYHFVHGDGAAQHAQA
ncbi:MAG: GvpL/GvpF family gas vesicle protein [Acidobacteriaceae bacterium]|nr:GvpL/GvpF family gas vesicle protein [Acidobacteriaceae bacterium]